MRHLLGYDRQTVGQHLTTNIANFFHHEYFPAELSVKLRQTDCGKICNYSDIGRRGVRKCLSV
jgi:hypothetical protein